MKTNTQLALLLALLLGLSILKASLARPVLADPPTPNPNPNTAQKNPTLVGWGLPHHPQRWHGLPARDSPDTRPKKSPAKIRVHSRINTDRALVTPG